MRQIMVKYISLLAVAGGLIVAAIWGCTKLGTEVLPPPQMEVVHSQSACLPGTESGAGAGYKTGITDPQLLGTFQSPCLGNLARNSVGSYDPGGTVRFAASHDTLFVYHDTAFYNCCSKIIFVLEMQGSTLDFIEVDTAAYLCDCMCYFDLQTAVAGLTADIYPARLWTAGKALLLGEQEVAVGGVNNVRFATRCDTLFVYHDARQANCGSKFVFDFQSHDRYLVFTEIDTSSAMLRCLCNFDLHVQLSGLADGIYTVQLWDGGNIHGFDPAPDSLIAESEIEIEISCP
jgi:hypothetical protein